MAAEHIRKVWTAERIIADWKIEKERASESNKKRSKKDKKEKILIPKKNLARNIFVDSRLCRAKPINCWDKKLFQ